MKTTVFLYRVGLFLLAGLPCGALWNSDLFGQTMAIPPYPVTTATATFPSSAWPMTAIQVPATSHGGVQTIPNTDSSYITLSPAPAVSPTISPVTSPANTHSVSRQSDTEEPLDVKVYCCYGPNLAELVQQLQSRFAASPEPPIISLGVPSADKSYTKISVVGSEAAQTEIQSFLARHRVLLEVPANMDVRQREGTVIPITGVSSKRQPFAGMTGQQSRLEMDIRTVSHHQIRETLQTVLGDRLVVPQQPQMPETFSYLYRIEKDGVLRQCTLNIVSGARSKAVVAGDTSLCQQFEVLLSAIDESMTTSYPSQSQPDRLFRIVPIRTADPAKIQQILEIDRQGGRSSSLEYRGQVPEFSAGGDTGGMGDMGSGMYGDNQTPGRAIDTMPEVGVQFLPDFGVVILDGPGAEVNRIMKMIETIQELSKNAEPKIEVYFLKNVDCLSLRYVIDLIGPKIFPTKQGQVTLFPMMNPNAVLLIGWGKMMETMKNLIDTLDRPIASEHGKLKIIRLNHASATYLARMITQSFPPAAVGTSGFLPRIQVIPDMRSNSLIVQAAPNDMDLVLRMVQELDVITGGPKLTVKHFRLKHSFANDLGDVLTDILTVGSGGVGVTEDRKLPSFVLERMTPSGRQFIESGIVADVQISKDVRNNLIIVTAPETSMELIAELIQLLDIPPATAEIKVYQMLFADATALLSTLQSLIPTQSTTQTGPQLSFAEGGESLVPLRFVVDQRTNCIIVAGSPFDIENIVEPLIVYLDKQNTEKRIRRVYQLRNHQASSIALAVNEYLRSKRLIQQAIPSMVSPYHQIEGEAIIVPDDVSNSLIIEAMPNYFEEIFQVISDLDRETPQVVIQVLIAEVALGKTDEFGAEFGFQDSLLFNRSSFSGTGTGTPGFLFNEDPTRSMGNNYQANPDSISSAGNVLPQMLTNFATKRVGADGIGGMVFSASSDAVSVMLRALQLCNRLEVLSRPQITAVDNQEAFILVGQQIPRVTSTSITNSGTQSSTTLDKVGLILMVTPRISPVGNRISLSIAAEKSKVSNSDGIIISSNEKGNIVSPRIDTIRTQTMVTASDDETVLLGGLITKEKEEIRRKVPYLADIPIIGKLFQYQQDSDRRAELLIIMTPKIVREQADMERIKQLEASRMNWCLSDVESLHGRTGLYDVYSTVPVTGRMETIEPDSIKLEDLREIPVPTLAP